MEVTTQEGPSPAFEHPLHDPELYPGVETFFIQNVDWLPELGIVDVDALNAMVDKNFVTHNREEKRLQEIGTPMVLLPDAHAYAPKFFSHMEENKDIYKKTALERREKRLLEEHEASENRVVREKRVTETRGKIERTSSAFLDVLDLSEVNADVDTNYWVVNSHDVHPYITKQADDTAVGLIIEQQPTVEFGAFTNAARGLQDHLTRGRIGRLLERADTLLISHADTFDTTILNTTGLTVGEYGEDASKKIAQTTAIIGKLLKGNQDAFRNLHEEFGHTLVRSKDVAGNEPVPMLSLYEGVLSIGQALNTLIQNKVEGFEDSDSLVEALVSQGVLLKFARSFNQIGIIGPINLTGYYIPNLVAKDESKDGRLVINAEYLATQKELKQARLRAFSKKIAATILANEPTDFDKIETVLTLEGCPATSSSYNPETGESRNVAQEMAELFMTVYKNVQQERVD